MDSEYKVKADHRKRRGGTAPNRALSEDKIKRYTREITYRDICSVAQEYSEAQHKTTLIIELFDGTRLVFSKYENCNIFGAESYNAEYDKFKPIFDQYMEFALLIQRDGKFPSDARKIVEGE